MATSLPKLRSLRPTALALALALPAAVAIGALSVDLKASTALTAPALASAAISSGFADVVTAVKPAVVHIRVAQSAEAVPRPEGLEPFFGEDWRRRFGDRAPRRPVQGTGSGFLVAPEGYIVTNDHVVGSAERISVTLNDGSQHSARLIGRDARTDLALLKIDAKEPLPFVRFAGSEPRVGDWVVAVGSPFGLGNTVTAGIVSAHGRSVGADGPFEGFMQIDAAINPGNSGGPAFNVKGEVVGVNTAIFTPSGGNVGIGFAVPADTAAMTIASLRESGRVERGWLGVSIQEVTPDLAEGFGLKEVRGALISKVSPESPAAKAGMREGDIVVRVNGAAVAAVRDLPRLVGSLKAGDAASIEVVRNGKIQNLTATVGRSPERDQVAGTQAPANAGLGLALAALDPSMRRNFGIGDNVDGVLIAAVRPDSAAAEEGLRAGDVIVAVGPSRVTQPAEIQDAVRLAERDRRKTVVLRVARGDYERFVALPIQPA